jgi:ABC-type phosphate/phosphonate transport system substrate-binding protein
MKLPVASLGMYDHPRQHVANDALWGAISQMLHARGIAVPLTLDRTRGVDQLWRDPFLLFGQACGYPLISQPDLALRVIAVPVYDVPDCDPGFHLSYIVARHDDHGKELGDYLGRGAAVNATDSNTGYNLFRAKIAPLAGGARFFGAVIETGSHRASIDALIGGKADIAAIDAVTYAAVARFEPQVTAGLRILAKTAPSPVPPFVTARRTSIEAVAALDKALAEVVADPALAWARADLSLADIVPASIAPYAALRSVENDAIAAGYPSLR